MKRLRALRREYDKRYGVGVVDVWIEYENDAGRIARCDDAILRRMDEWGAWKPGATFETEYWEWEKVFAQARVNLALEEAEGDENNAG